MEDGAMSGLGDFWVLSEPLLLRIFRLLDWKALLVLTRVNRSLRTIASDEKLWKSLDLREPGCDLASFKGSWRDHFLTRKSEGQYVAIRTYNKSKDRLSSYRWAKEYRSTVDVSCWHADDNHIPKRESTSLSPTDFHELFDKNCLPIILYKGMDAWKSFNEPSFQWTLSKLQPRFNSVLWEAEHKVKDLKRLRVSMAAYEQYCNVQKDEFPLYIFDKAFGEKCPEMLKEYWPPHQMDEDFLSVLEDERPPYRWFVAGPQRSGTPWHIDPFCTSAWNALITGRKRWALYPPGWMVPGVKWEEEENGEFTWRATPSVKWFLDTYPHIPEEYRPIEFVQHPGEVVFIPWGWWHATINLEESTAVTQNFISSANIGDFCEYLLTRGGKRIETYKALREHWRRQHPEVSPLIFKSSLHWECGFSERDELVKQIKDNPLWEKTCRELLSRRLNISEDAPFERLGGENFVFRVGDIVVKIFSPWGGGLDAWKAETSTYRGLERCAKRGLAGDQPTIELLDKGKLVELYRQYGDPFPTDCTRSWIRSVLKRPSLIGEDCPCVCDTCQPPEDMKVDVETDWAWPYVITKALDHGSTLSEAKRLGAMIEAPTVATFLGKSLRKFHDLLPFVDEDLAEHRSNFASYLRDHHASAIPKAWGSRCIKPSLVKQLTSYLTQSCDSFAQSADLVWSHGDLNEANVYGVLCNTRQRDDEDGADTWSPTCLLDFGDAMAADRMYDLVTLHIGIFKLNRHLLRTFMEAYGREMFPTGRDFSFKAMMLTFCYRTDALSALIGLDPSLGEVSSLYELELNVWSLE